MTRCDMPSWEDAKRYLDIDFLRKLGAEPRVHGNGFVQLDVGEGRRLHVWGYPGTPRQQVATPIHSHRFGFTSVVLRGRLVNVNYWTAPDEAGPFEVYQPVPRFGEDTELVKVGGLRVVAQPSHTDNVPEGWMYSMRMCAFHETFAPETTVTLLTKTEEAGAHYVPGVLCAYGQTPDNRFDRHRFHSGYLWSIISDAVAGHGALWV